ncbi:MAG: hydroxymethylpyrimidine/phosphomethylpyrimidine kinase [Bacteroides sp.]|nr:hydroxymethylpyrimidine/phosphomethylpyrimidine kinase [Bacteroides sp.]MCM1447561.1 hydroxymethylpyrimidine/phosphomethylpyrimidine kinase [Bacteroides sp.]MCM1516992.1 hydroxymethylpyrimidine/phosphomethylpyrimidine kinase [Paraprevotella sp.]
MKKQLDIVFLIAGSEPLGSAGIQADIKAITACGGYAAGALTAIVDEDTRHVKSIHHLPVDLIVSQTESFLGDVGAQCVKTGVLPSKAIIEGVAGKLARYPQVLKVIDPVIVDSNGVKLVADDAIQAYKNLLFPQATLITPNRREAETLLGHPLGNIEEDLRTLSAGTCSVIIKSVETGNGRQEQLTDYLYDITSDTVTSYTKDRIPTHNVNGTGDSFASSIATYLAKGYCLQDAVARGEEFIQRAISLGAEYNFGSGYGPVHPCFMEDRSKHDRIYG